QDADGDDVEQRHEERRGERAVPGAQVDPPPVVDLPGDELAGAGCGGGGRTRDPGRVRGVGAAHQSTNDRPVRWRKTSSRVERRTSTAAGCRPRSCTFASVSSPWAL